MRARRETRRALTQAGLRVGQRMTWLAPLLGLLVFGLVDFKPAVTLYAVVIGLAVLLSHVLEQVRLSLEVQETIRRYLHGNHAH